MKDRDIFRVTSIADSYKYGERMWDLDEVLSKRILDENPELYFNIGNFWSFMDDNFLFSIDLIIGVEKILDYFNFKVYSFLIFLICISSKFFL